MLFTTKKFANIHGGQILILRTVLVLAAVLALWSSLSASAFAVKNNKDNLSNDKVLRLLRSHSQNVDRDYVNNYGGPNLTVKSPPCLVKNGKPIYHFQVPWLSLAGKPAEDKPIVADQGVDSVALQYNRVGGFCHYVFTSVLPLSSSKIVDPTELKVTGTKLTGVSASIVEGSKTLQVSGLSAGQVLDTMDYDYARAHSLRFVKDGNQPYSNGLTVKGLKSLDPGTYTIRLTVTARLVNRFSEGDKALYLCVAGGAKTKAESWSTDCPDSISTLDIKLTIPKQYDGFCTISGVPPTLASGQQFTPTITVTNSGAKDWLVEPNDAKKYFKLRPVAGNPWGKKSVLITGAGVVGSKLPAKSSTVIKNETFTAPTGTIPDFSWRIVYDGVGAGEPGIPERIDLPCTAPVNTKVNQPFLRVSGGDTVAGASFSNNEDEVNQYFYQSDNAKDAEINTNGKNVANGSSSSEYAVFASGFINKISGLPNQFSSNDFYEPSGVKDLTFANTGVPSGGTNYGKFYGDTVEPALPNVDITKLVEIAKAAQAENKFPNSISQLNKNLSNSVDNTGAGQKGGSAYFTGDMNTTVPQSGIPYTMQGSKVIVLDGNLEIRNNLNYGPGENNLILIVLGNINITSNVTSLQGTYIAFPKDDSTGIVDTCSNIDDDKLTVDSANCGNKLTITGRLIASKVLWKRTYGTLGPGGGVANNRCVYPQGGYSGCAAEFINFLPEVYFNSPLGSNENHTGDKPSNVPNNTLDLPPVY